MLIGKVITRDLVITLLKLVGVRLTTQQAAKFVPSPARRCRPR
jgi:hypothetical protein